MKKIIVFVAMVAIVHAVALEEMVVERPHTDDDLEAMAVADAVEEVPSECTASAAKLVEHVLDVSENLGNCRQLPPIFDGSLFQAMGAAIARAPRRLKTFLVDLYFTTGNLMDFVKYIQGNVTMSVQNVTFVEITNDGGLIESIVGRKFLYEGDKNLNETCEIVEKGKAVTDLYNINIIECVQNLVMNLTDGIQDIQEQFMYIKNNVSDPTLWSHNATMEPTLYRIDMIQKLTNTTSNFIRDLDPRLDSALEWFAYNASLIAQQAQTSFGGVLTDLMTLQASQGANTTCVETQRPSIVEKTVEIPIEG